MLSLSPINVWKLTIIVWRKIFKGSNNCLKYLLVKKLFYPRLKMTRDGISETTWQMHGCSSRFKISNSTNLSLHMATLVASIIFSNPFYNPIRKILKLTYHYTHISIQQTLLKWLPFGCRMNPVNVLFILYVCFDWIFYLYRFVIIFCINFFWKREKCDTIPWLQ